MKRHNLVLAAVLVVQIGLSVFVLWPKAAATGESKPLFPGLEADAILALTVTDDQENTITLQKKMGEWVVPAVDDYPAKSEKVEPVLEKLTALDTGRLVTRTDASHKRLKVAADEFARYFSFETADGNSYALYLGPGPAYSASYFRLDGKNEVYLADDLSTWDVGATVTNWIDTNYFGIGEEELDKVTLENGNGTFVFSRDVEGNWTLAGLRAGEQVNSDEITTVINRVTSIILLRPLGKTEDPSYAFDDPNAVVTLEAGGQTITLTVGSQHPDDNSYVIKVSESPYYVRVAGYGFKELVETTRDDFLQQPTPVPEPSPTPEA